MRKKFNILNLASRKVFSISIILFMSFNFSVLGSQAKICKGGPDCANCIELAHSHMPWVVAEIENSSCKSGFRNTDCGFEDGPIPDDANRIALTDRLDSQAFSGIFKTESVVYTRPNPSCKFPFQFDSRIINSAIPVYLLNDSLLC